MAENAEEDTSGLKDIGEFLKAMGSRYGRVPALKRLGRVMGKWFLGGVVFVAVCIVGETMGVGFRKAAEMYWRWWVGPPFFIAFGPIVFTFFIAAIQLVCYAIILPFVLIGALLGYDRSTASKHVSSALVYLGFAFFLAWAAHDSARRDAAPKPATKAVAATTAVRAQSQQPLPPAAPSTPGHRFDWKIIVVAVLSFCGGIAKTTVSSVTGKWAEHVFDKRKRVVIYGPNDRPK